MIYWNQWFVISASCHAVNDGLAYVYHDVRWQSYWVKWVTMYDGTLKLRGKKELALCCKYKGGLLLINQVHVGICPVLELT